ncbi:ABC transporter permease [Roseisolibacter sp. H3M3-2]|uniref:ABC transporter permease n=1 Tax=Roseisolibacter sp. H3M3-2 TaxID=3031323 RepID=UPI0023DB3631|nr:ABC transporter permease [Roseisolibacter sp. H3M3-2]MDF1501612.1 ABC transporter permease [Roseisolibacter sp. H3M3-2]
MTLRPLAVGLATALLAVGALVLLLALTGHDPAAALGALWAGAAGSRYALLSATLVRAVPLILAGLAVAVAFRAGILNVGAEGQLLAGGGAATAVGLALGAAPAIVALPAALLAGVAAGAAWAGIAAVLRRRFGVLEVISTIMLNFVALHAAGWLVRGPLQEPQRIYPQSPSLGAAAQLPVIVPGSRLHLGFALAVAAGVALWAFLRFTAAGFRLRATGLNPFAAASAGRIDVAAVTTAAFLASGALAGLAGAVEVTGVTYALYENLSPGYGYTAIAVALLARLHPLGVVASGILFGALEAGAGAMQRDAGVPAVVVTVVEALLILLVLAADRLGERLRERAPAPAAAVPAVERAEAAA